MAPTEEQALLARLKADDRSALRELFETHYTMVCQAIFQFVRDQSTTEDLAQEVFLRFWEKRHQIEVNSSLPAYLRRMGVNEGLGHLRKAKRWSSNELEAEQVLVSEHSVESDYLHSELEQRITVAINALPPRCRTVFQLSRFEDLTYQEIADQMEISIKTVEHQMGKALRVLRERLEQYLHFWWLFPLFIFLSLAGKGNLGEQYTAERQPTDIHQIAPTPPHKVVETRAVVKKLKNTGFPIGGSPQPEHH